MQDQTDPLQVSEPLQTAADVGELLGVTPRTVYLWARTGRLPSFRVGGAVRFRRSEIEAWLQDHRALEAVV